MSYFEYPQIDMKKTGQKLREECMRQNYTVRDIQRYLQIGAYQSVYAWFSGKALPSLDNMYALSRLLGRTMEELIVCQKEENPYKKNWRILETSAQKRIWAYRCFGQEKMSS